MGQENLGSVFFEEENCLSFFNRAESRDFCEPDDGGVYVDLKKNPERFTGYSGDNAAQVWRAIYQENCFVDKPNPLKPNDGDCLEKQAFYRLVSGMHASISTHIASNYYSKQSNSWGRNATLYWERVGNFPDRVENLRFAFAMVLRAVSKASEYLLSYDMKANSLKEEKAIKLLLKQILDLSKQCPQGVEAFMFTDPSSQKTKEQLRKYFSNLGKLMNCLSCEKCRLWGKIQTKGLGTALKILFSFPSVSNKSVDYQLTRSEVVALINTMNRWATSLNNILAFQDECQDFRLRTGSNFALEKGILLLVGLILVGLKKIMKQ